MWIGVETGGGRGGSSFHHTTGFLLGRGCGVEEEKRAFAASTPKPAAMGRMTYKRQHYFATGVEPALKDALATTRKPHD